MVRPLARRLGGAFLGQMTEARDPRWRHLQFEMLSQSKSLLFVDAQEKWLVRAGDEYIGRELFVTGEYDFDKFELALEFLANHGVKPQRLVDVGANIGSICIPAVARGLVQAAIAVEPDDENVRLLRANIALNGLHEKIEVVTAAASDAAGELRFQRSRFNFGDHRIAFDQEGAVGVIVAAERLDRLAASFVGRETILWLDVQGAEAHALQGATKLIEAGASVVIEFDPKYLDPAGRIEQLFEILRGFDLIYLIRNDCSHRIVLDVRELAQELRATGAYCDLLAVRR